MKRASLISTGVLLLLLGAVAPTYARQEQHQQESKATKQEEKAKPAQQQHGQQQHQTQQHQQQAKSQQQHARTANQNEQRQAKTQQNHERSQQHQQQASRQHQQSQGHWARNGQRDSRGHVYSTSRFGRDHHARFEPNGGRFYNGRREYSYGGYWFYAGFYPPWFYQQQVYFVMGADGLWYAVAYDNPSLTFQVNIE